jgi:hypothetical protein
LYIVLPNSRFKRGVAQSAAPLFSSTPGSSPKPAAVKVKAARTTRERHDPTRGGVAGLFIAPIEISSPGASPAVGFRTCEEVPFKLADQAETPIRLDEGRTLIFPATEPEKSFLLKLIEGVVHVLSRVPQALTSETPIVAAYIEGTEFVLGVSEPGPSSGCSKGGSGFRIPRANWRSGVGELHSRGGFYGQQRSQRQATPLHQPQA